MQIRSFGSFVRLLAIAILFQAPAYLFADAVSGGGKQPYRSYAQMGTLFLNGIPVRLEPVAPRR